MKRIICAGVALASIAAAKSLAQERTPLERCLAAKAQGLDFSGVVSVVRPGGATVHARGVVGGPGSPASSGESRFNLGSAGKMFTAVAVAQLVDAGKVALDEPIGRRIDGLKPETAAVTVRQLLTHSSGLGNFFSPENLPAIEKARTVADLMPLVASETPAFAPGARFQYSNSGFLLLGRLIERVSGQNYGEYLAAHIFRPAGMVQTGLDPVPSQIQAVGMTAMPASRGSAAAARDMRPLPGGPDLEHGPLRPAAEAALHGNPAGGSYSTATDMQRFFAALLAGKLTSAAMLAKLTSPQIVAQPASAAGPRHDYGLGFGVGAFDGHRWFGHNGGAPGVTVETAAFPEDGTTVIVLSNRDPPTGSVLFREVRKTLFDPEAMKSCAGPGTGP